MEYSNLFVCIMGVGTVFFGLVCLIGITMLMSALCGKGQSAAPKAAAVPAVPAPAGNREELAAAIAAAVAEELGTDVSGLRIISMKKL